MRSVRWTAEGGLTLIVLTARKVPTEGDAGPKDR